MIRKVTTMAAVLLTSLGTVTAGEWSEVECLAHNMYHEAKGEGEFGRLLVAEVTLTRRDLKSFPDTICGVVYQSKQFSWTTSHKGNDIPYYAKVNMMREASNILEGRVTMPGLKADHYYAPKGMMPRYRVPAWAIGEKPLLTYKGHKFYKLRNR